MRTVKAPGTEMSTTFFPFQSSVFRPVAAGDLSYGNMTPNSAALTDTAGRLSIIVRKRLMIGIDLDTYVIFELWRVSHVLERAGRNGVANFNDHVVLI